MKKFLGKTALLAYFTACMLLMMTRSAKAYVDPTTTTFIIQAVSGVAIAVGAFLVIHFRRAKKKVAEKLNIDENRNKEVEDDIEEIDD